MVCTITAGILLQRPPHVADDQADAVGGQQPQGVVQEGVGAEGCLRARRPQQGAVRQQPAQRGRDGVLKRHNAAGEAQRDD
jgi:hypothetical protein